MPVKVEPIPPLPGLSSASGKPPVASFYGGRLSSDDGVLALREVELMTRITLHLPAACPDQAIFRLVLDRPPRLAC